MVMVGGYSGTPVRRAVGLKCERKALEVLARFLFLGKRKRHGGQKYRTNQGRQQNDKLQNIIQTKAIRGEMSETEME